MKEAILNHLPGGHPWQNLIRWYDTIDSTNSRLRLLATTDAPHGTVLAAGHQFNGRGRMGRSFESPAGMGIYLSVLLRPDCTANKLMHLTCATAEAMCDAVEAACGLRPGIKWTNDLVCGGRKLGGILTELSLAPNTGFVEWAVVGIGINCHQTLEDFPPELRDMAGSLEMVTGKPVDSAALAAHMIDALSRMDAGLLGNKAALMEAYRRDCITLGQEILLVRGEERQYGTAITVDEDGGLLVAFRDGSVKTVTSGEVSVRGMYSYV